MAKAEFTHELRKLPSDPVGIEDYVVRAAGGEPVGNVAALLERRGQRLLVVESGVPPLKAVRRALSWERVEQVDHDALAVWLQLDASSFEQQAVELDPERAVEQGEREAEATRIGEPPPDLIPPAQRGRLRGPVDRTMWAKAFALFALTAFMVLVATIVVAATGDTGWAALYAVPAVSAAAAAVLGYRAYRRPYEPRASRKP